MAQAGVEIYKRFYPWPTRFRLGDPVLVREVTGMDWPEFVDALAGWDENSTPDQVVLAGMIAVAFWQGQPTMSRDKARRAVELMPQEDVEVIEGDDDEEADVSPPGVAADEAAGLTPAMTLSGSEG